VKNPQNSKQHHRGLGPAFRAYEKTKYGKRHQECGWCKKNTRKNTKEPRKCEKLNRKVPGYVPKSTRGKRGCDGNEIFAESKVKSETKKTAPPIRKKEGGLCEKPGTTMLSDITAKSIKPKRRKMIGTENGGEATTQDETKMQKFPKTGVEKKKKIANSQGLIRN